MSRACHGRQRRGPPDAAVRLDLAAFVFRDVRWIAGGAGGFGLQVLRPPLCGGFPRLPRHRRVGHKLAIPSESLRHVPALFAGSYGSARLAQGARSLRHRPQAGFVHRPRKKQAPNLIASRQTARAVVGPGWPGTHQAEQRTSSCIERWSGEWASTFGPMCKPSASEGSGEKGGCCLSGPIGPASCTRPAPDEEDEGSPAKRGRSTRARKPMPTPQARACHLIQGKRS